MAVLHATGDTEKLALACVLTSIVFQNFGAAFAKSLFPIVGVEGVLALRLGLAACVIGLIWPPWRSLFVGTALAKIVLYGTTLGLMNFFIYKAFELIPIGVAMALELTGPLAVAIMTSRRLNDLIFTALTAAGLLLLLPIGAANEGLSLRGVAFALAAAVCWGSYILLGRRMAGANGNYTVAGGLLVAAIFAVPLGVIEIGTSLLNPYAIAIGLIVAVLSSGLPYLLEMRALKTLPACSFGLSLSLAPVVAAFVGLIFLNENLMPTQWIAIMLIVAAAMGSALSRQ